LLIIFDLDDTLIDTAGSILPFRRRQVLERMAEEGVAIDPEMESLYASIDERSRTSREALQKFLGTSHHLLEESVKTLYGASNFPFPIRLTPGTNESLFLLSQEHTLSIVTYGNPLIQKKKIEKAGLDRALFSNIVVCEQPIKGPHYKTIFENSGEVHSDVIVCGDRVGRDLLPAKELGFTTVLMRWGRGKSEPFDPQVVDHQITSIHELLQMNCLR